MLGGEDNKDENSKIYKKIIGGIAIFVILCLCCFCFMCCSYILSAAGASKTATEEAPYAAIPDMSTPTDTSAYEPDAGSDSDDDSGDSLFDTLDTGSSEAPPGAEEEKKKKKKKNSSSSSSKKKPSKKDSSKKDSSKKDSSKKKGSSKKKDSKKKGSSKKKDSKKKK